MLDLRSANTDRARSKDATTSEWFLTSEISNQKSEIFPLALYLER